MSPHIQNMFIIINIIIIFYTWYTNSIASRTSTPIEMCFTLKKNLTWQNTTKCRQHKQNQCTLEFASKLKKFIYKQNKTKSKK
jgi:hypothetical protein